MAVGRIMQRVLIILSLAIFFGWPVPVNGAPIGGNLLQQSTPAGGFHHIKAAKQPSVGARCVRTRKHLGRYQIVNRCSICRSVQIQHQRPNNRPAILRDYYVPPGAKISLPFRGKGRTRVLTDTPCEQNDRRAKSAEKRSQSCVRMRRNGNSLVLINVCSVCKAGIVERLFNGGRRNQQTLAIQSNGFSPVSANGAQSARLISETPCR
jgi:hypothetical protein